MLKLGIENKGDKMKERKIPAKNYIIFAIMTVAVIVGVLYTARYYALSRDFYLDYSYVSSVIPNLDEATFDDYIKERPEVVLYIADSKDSSIKNFEKKFKKIIINHNIKEDIVYLDSSKLEGDSFYNNFSNNYSSKLNITNIAKFKLKVPNLIYFENGEAVKILYKNEDDVINIDDVQSFLIDCEVISID